MQSGQVSHLFLCPGPNHFSRILTAVALPEPELSGDVLVSVLENEDRRFVDLDGAIATLLGRAVVDVGLLAG